MFKALDRAAKDPELARQIVAMQASVVDATIQALSAAEVGEAINDDLFHWKQKWVGQSMEVREFFMGNRLMGLVRMRLDSGDRVHLEAELALPEQPEELAKRDPMGFAPGENVMTIQHKRRVIHEPTVNILQRVAKGAKPN